MSARKVMLWLAAPLLWFAHFNLLYGVASLGLARHWPAGVVGALSWAFTIGAVLAILVVLLRLRLRRDGDDAWRIAGIVGLLSLVAVLLQALVLLLMPT